MGLSEISRCQGSINGAGFDPWVWFLTISHWLSGPQRTTMAAGNKKDKNIQEYWLEKSMNTAHCAE